MATSVLITGATGLIGSRLTELLLEKGLRVKHLGRTSRAGPVPSFTWDIEKGEMDSRALDGVDVIIHLAGAGVADKRWSRERKQEILNSRTHSTALLFDTLQKTQHMVKTVVSASAIGYYGYGLDATVYTEESTPGGDYLARVVVQWERGADRIAELNIRVVKIRIGIVLSASGGALNEMARPVNWGIGAPLGTGRQMISWIHLEDLCALFMKAIGEESMKGAYNAVTPYPVTNREITREIARLLRRPLWLPPVPPFVLHWLLGEMADVVINGRNVASTRLGNLGFRFQFPELGSALKDLLNR